MAGPDPAIQRHKYNPLNLQPLDGRLEGGHGVKGEATAPILTHMRAGGGPIQATTSGGLLGFPPARE